MLHDPVDQDTLKLFKEGKHPGPDLSDFHFDLPEGLLSPWNQKTMDVLQEGFAEWWDKQSEIDDIERLEQYWVDAEKQWFMTLAGIWRKPIPIMIGNRIETDLQAEFHLKEMHTNKARYGRHHCRCRTTVSIDWLSYTHTTDKVLSNLSAERKLLIRPSTSRNQGETLTSPPGNSWKML